VSCLSSSETFGWLVELTNKKGEKAEQGILLDRILCPVHFCFDCGEKVSKAHYNSLHTCIKCCKTYHPKCLPKATGFTHLQGSYYLCEGHLPPRAHAALEREYKLIHTDKKDILELRKAERAHRQKQNDFRLFSQPVVPERDYDYSDFLLTPVQDFNYGNYTKDNEYWCRYCGSRFADGFDEGPWGLKTLCRHHFKLWKKGKLELEEGGDRREPLMRKETELRFLNKMAREKKVHPSSVISLLL
jgi:hypothetical protein